MRLVSVVGELHAEIMSSRLVDAADQGLDKKGIVANAMPFANEDDIVTLEFADDVILRGIQWTFR